jgi:phage N-6-adenine-methyltransferase
MIVDVRTGEVLEQEPQVWAEFRELIPPLKEGEFEQLRDNILSEGIRDALVIWKEEGVLLDGHNRLSIAQNNGLDYRVTTVNLPNKEAARRWILLNQLGRRNLTPQQMAYIRGKLYQEEKKAVTNPGGANQYTAVGDQNDHQPKTSERIAEQTGVSAPTVRRDADFAEAVDRLAEVTGPEARDRILSGEVRISKKDVVEAAELADEAPDLIPDIASGKRKMEDVRAEKKKNVHVSNNSGNNEWYTPIKYIEAARNVMGSIDCDPASSEIANKTVRAKIYYTIDDNGLSRDWIGNVWMNPPYSQPAIQEFATKLTNELSRDVSQACVLVNNATETKWFHTLLLKVNCICLIKGRVKFVDIHGRPTGAPLQGQVVLYFGDNTEEFNRIFSKFGRVMYAW